jgi:hypothetical protein
VFSAVTIETNGLSISTESKDFIIQTIEKMSQALSKSFSLPSDVAINLVDVSGDYFGVSGDNTIYGFSALSHDDVNILPKSILATAYIHEFSHLVFYTDLKRIDPRLDFHRPSLHQMRLRSLEIKSLLKNGFDPLLQKELNTLTSVLNELSYVKDLEKVSLPYNELFADIVAVLFQRDGKAIYAALDPSKKNSIYRDFTIKYTLEETIGWNEKTEYSLLAPARRFIWSNILAQFLDKPTEDFQTLLKQLEIIFAHEIISILEMPDHGNELTPGQINLRLIDRLRENFLSLNPS